MPAIDPKRLRVQMDELMDWFTSPVQFHQCLQDLFSLYANRALRFSDAVPTQPLIPSYNLPQPVIRQLSIDLARHIKENPQAALLLADRLWEDSHLEIKRTAINILGAVPIHEPEPILTRISDWISPELENTLTMQLVSTGARRLQEDFPEDWERLIVSLLEKDQPKWVALGIKGLTESIKNPGFKNLPAVLRLISPIIRNPKSAFRKDLYHLVSELVQRSPAETALFLKQAHAMSKKSGTERLIKDCLDLFPDELRDDLKSTLG